MIVGLFVAVAAVGWVALVSEILMIIGSLMMRSPSKPRVRMGSVVVLIFTLVGALFTFGGFVIGFILALVGSIPGLTWKPSPHAPESPPAPPPMAA